MEIETFMLCRYVEVQSSQLYVMGGGINQLLSTVYPTGGVIGVAIIVQADPTETGEHSIRFEFQDPDGKKLGFSTEIPFEFNNDKRRWTLGANIPISLPRPGPYSMRLFIDNKFVKMCDIEAIQTKPTT